MPKKSAPQYRAHYAIFADRNYRRIKSPDGQKSKLAKKKKKKRQTQTAAKENTAHEFTFKRGAYEAA